MNTTTKQRREELKAISQPFKLLIKEGAIGSINEGLIDLYASQGHSVLKSYNAWKKDGFHVRKGEKALLLWGQPLPIPNQEPKPKTDQDSKEETFFPLAYVFSQLQVEKND